MKRSTKSSHALGFRARQRWRRLRSISEKCHRRDPYESLIVSGLGRCADRRRNREMLAESVNTYDFKLDLSNEASLSCFIPIIVRSPLLDTPAGEH